MKNIAPVVLLLVWLALIHVLASDFRSHPAIHNCQDTGDC
jgi:hypothetical protein